MLHVWLIPLLVFVALVVGGLYFLVRLTGGSGDRVDGKTLVDKPSPVPDEDMP